MGSGLATALSGIMVLELGDFVTAPWAARCLGDLGADVIKVEPPRLGDRSRHAGPFASGRPDPEASGLFVYLNAGKRSVTIDVGTDQGREIVLELVARADVVVENFRAIDRAAPRIAVEDLQAANDAAVIVSISPFGRSGPRAHWLGGELVAFHASGIGYETPTGPFTDLQVQQPLKAPGYQASFSAGWMGALGAMTALLHRDLTGHGQHVDVSEQEALASHVRQNTTLLSYDGLVNERVTTQPNSLSMTFGPCMDGLFAGPSLGFTPRDWERLRSLLGNPEWADHPDFATPDGRLNRRDDVHAIVAEWKLGFTRDELFDLVQRAGVVGFPLNTVGEAITTKQLQERDALGTINHHALGSVLVPRPPWISDGTRPLTMRDAPALGEHTDQVLRDVLGYDADRCTELRRRAIT